MNIVETSRSIAVEQKSWSHLQANLQTVVINLTVGMCYVLATVIHQTYAWTDLGSFIPNKEANDKISMKQIGRPTFACSLY